MSIKKSLYSYGSKIFILEIVYGLHYCDESYQWIG